MSWRVPLTTAALTDADVAAYIDCLRGGWLTMGPRTQAFEERFGAYVGGTDCLAVSSGTAGLQLALLGLGVDADDEVILPTFTFVAAANAVCAVGAHPVFCDSTDPLDPVLDVDAVLRLVSSSTRAIVVSHLFGFPASLDRLKDLCDERDIRLVEDCTTALGATAPETERQVGTLGDVGVFSFRSSGPLPLGEGGMVVTDDDTVARRVRMLRSHAMTSVTWDRHRGHATTYDVVDIGFNYRLDEPRSAMGLRRLEDLDDDREHRRALARRYRDRLREVPSLSVPWGDDRVAFSSPWGFAVAVAERRDRDQLRRRLRAEGIQSAAHPTVTQLSRYRASRPAEGFPHAEQFAERHCVLPLSSTTTEDDVNTVLEALLAFDRSRDENG